MSFLTTRGDITHGPSTFEYFDLTASALACICTSSFGLPPALVAGVHWARSPAPTFAICVLAASERP